jgi:hypothetical protein
MKDGAEAIDGLSIRVVDKCCRRNAFGRNKGQKFEETDAPSATFHFNFAVIVIGNPSILQSLAYIPPPQSTVRLRLPLVRSISMTLKILVERSRHIGG